jgi:hypothetical protein
MQGASHVGVDVGGVVFDNFHPTGVPRAEWLRDLGVGETDAVQSFTRTFEQFLTDL